MKTNRIKRHLWQLNQARGLPNLSRPIRRSSNNREFAAAPKRLKAKKKIRSIVVPLDGSTFAEHAIPLALEFAKRSGASLQLVQVLSTLEFDGQFHSDHVHEWLINSLKQKRSNICPMPFSVSVVRAAYRPRPWSRRGEVSATPPRRSSGWMPISLSWQPWSRRDWPILARKHRLFALGTNQGAAGTRRGHQQPVKSKPKRIDHAILALDGTESVERILSSVLDLDALSSARHTLLRVLKLDRRSQIQAGRRRSVAVPSQSRILGCIPADGSDCQFAGKTGGSPFREWFTLMTIKGK